MTVGIMSRIVEDKKCLLPPPFERGEEFFAFLDEFGLIPKDFVTSSMIEAWAIEFAIQCSDRVCMSIHRDLYKDMIKRWYERNRQRADLLQDQLKLF